MDVISCEDKDLRFDIAIDKKSPLNVGWFVNVYLCQVKKYKICRKKKFGIICRRNDVLVDEITAVLKLSHSLYGNILIKEETKRLLSTLNHTAIVNLIYPQKHLKCFLKHHLILLEHCRGGDLLIYYNNISDTFTEKETKIIIFQIIQAVKKLHEQGLVHLDIKLENIGLQCLNDIHNIKLLDFGSSMEISTHNNKNFISTSGNYTPPEIYYNYLLDKKFLVCIDFWEIGVLLFSLLYKYYPFQGDGTYIINWPKKNLIDPQYVQFIKDLLQIQPQKRLNLDNIDINFDEDNLFTDIFWEIKDDVILY